MPKLSTYTSPFSLIHTFLTPATHQPPLSRRLLPLPADNLSCCDSYTTSPTTPCPSTIDWDKKFLIASISLCIVFSFTPNQVASDILLTVSPPDQFVVDAKDPHRLICRPQPDHLESPMYSRTHLITHILLNHMDT